MPEENNDRPQAAWDRSTPWRQGSLISPDDAVKLGLIKEGLPADSVVVVISHPCDIVCDDLAIEPSVEVVVGKRIDVIDGNYTNAKNPRTLHMEVSVEEFVHRFCLVVTQKLLVKKTDLANLAPQPGLAIIDRNLQILQSWLAARYRRAAFPNELVTRLKPIDEVLSKESKRTSNEIVAIFLDYEPENQELEKEKLYSLSITVVYSTEVENAAATAEVVVEKVKAAFEKNYRKGNDWKGIELKFCGALRIRNKMNHAAFRKRQQIMAQPSLRNAS